MNRLVAKYLAWRQFRETRDELMGLSDRSLEDIGLTRGSIAQALRKPGRGRSTSL